MLVREKDLCFYEDELYHTGVKGMKWGHRKSYLKTLNKGQQKKIKKQFKKDVKEYSKLNDKRYSSWSSKPILELNNYLNKTTMQKGENYTQAVVKKARLKPLKSMLTTTAAVTAIAAGSAVVYSYLGDV